MRSAAALQRSAAAAESDDEQAAVVEQNGTGSPETVELGSPRPNWVDAGASVAALEPPGLSTDMLGRKVGWS